MRTTRALLSLAFGLTLLGCSDSVSPIERQLEVAEARWQAQALSQYVVESRGGCFMCVPIASRWHRLRVVNATVEEVTLIDPAATPDDGPVLGPASFRSVEQTFARIREWPQLERGNRVEAEFDPVTGLPTEVHFIAPSSVADGGFSVSFRALAPGLSSAGASVHR